MASDVKNHPVQGGDNKLGVNSNDNRQPTMCPVDRSEGEVLHRETEVGPVEGLERENHAQVAGSQHDIDGHGAYHCTGTLTHSGGHCRDPSSFTTEIEAVEACQWLRAAGFPQYAQMFEDGLFPVDISDVQRDHDFLDGDSIQSLFRRLNILNQCAVMKIDTQPRRKAIEESDEEDLSALSDRWEYQKNVRRWSRKGPYVGFETGTSLQPSTSHDSLLADQDSGSHTDDSPVLDSKMPHVSAVRNQDQPPVVIPEGQGSPNTSSFPISPKLRRAASERLKSALKKMESFKKKSKKYPASRNIVEISDPVVADQAGMQAKLEHLNCVDLSPAGTTPGWRTSPDRESTPKESGGKFSKVHTDRELGVSPVQPISPITLSPLSQHSLDDPSTPTQTNLSLSEYYTAHSQLLASFQSCSGVSVATSPVRKNSSDTNLKEIFLLPQDHKPGSFPRLLHNGYIDTSTTPRSHALPIHPTTETGVTPGTQVRSTMEQQSNKWMPSRASVYDNLPNVASSHGGDARYSVNSRLQGNRPGQVVRSHSISASDCILRETTPDTVRSRSSSASTSFEQSTRTSQNSQHSRAPSDGYHTLTSAGIPSEDEADVQPSVSMDEFDSILQGLYREISDLSHAISHEASPARDTGHLQVQAVSSSGHTVSSNTIQQSTTQHSDHECSNIETVGSMKQVLSVAENTKLTTADTEGSETVRHEISFEPVDDSVDAELEEEGERGSHTGSSHTSSEQEEEDFSADDTLEQLEKSRERRDSGVGSSLTRTSSERKQKKIRWHSFQKCHRPSVGSRELQIGGLSVCQLLPIRQLSLLKLTAIMEKCSPTTRSQWSWSVPRFMKRNKVPQFTDKNVFGVPLTITLQRTGQPLPQCVLYAMRYLRRTSHDALGIFRKSGVRSRIQKLRDMVEACPDSISFDELQPYDVADLLKQYFRELPECLLTNKLSDTFRSIFTNVPMSQRLEALQTAVILLPEENLEVLHCLLLFLGDIAEHAHEHQMNASNLAVCFAPSLFNLSTSHGSGSPRRQRKSPGVPDQRELLEQKAVHECFTFMITHCKKLFMVPPSMYSRLHLSTLSNMEPVHLDEFYAYSGHPGPDYRAFGEEHIQILLKEAHDKNRGWAPVTVNMPGIEVTQRKPQDGHPLRQWKCSVEIEAPPIEVLNRILHERHTWDDDLLSWSVVERLDKNADVFHYVLNSMAPHPPRHFTIIRYWRPDLVKGACAFVSRSVEHTGLQVTGRTDEGVRAVELGSYYLMEPCGSGRSRFTFISRTDLRGRCPEWYNRVFGHLCANFVDRLRDSFRQEADGPETKV
ncbi:hypothetical protein BaRGS_00012255 [Batillaria attramentaria]|uniref:Uncharacterized protein n=1 Tax=Batillaria attramentaria TaxID=370345 RepID=A0ABD0LBG6_9CAEN